MYSDINIVYIKIIIFHETQFIFFKNNENDDYIHGIFFHMSIDVKEWYTSMFLGATVYESK